MMRTLKKKRVECNLGIKVVEPIARYVDALLPSLPKDNRYSYRRKGSISSTEEVGERTDVSKITTSVMDRDFELVVPEGIDKTQYDLNRIVLFGHDQMKPIGMALWVRLEGNALIAKTVYESRPKDYVGEFIPDFVWAMRNILKGRSIGFLPLDVTDPTDEELAINPDLQQVIRKCLLLEFSVVSVPSNPLALVESWGKGLGLDHWKMEFPTKKVAKKKKIKSINHQKVLADAMSTLEFDAKKITEMAMQRLIDKWEI